MVAQRETVVGDRRKLRRKLPARRRPKRRPRRPTKYPSKHPTRPRRPGHKRPRPGYKSLTHKPDTKRPVGIEELSPTYKKRRTRCGLEEVLAGGTVIAPCFSQASIVAHFENRGGYDTSQALASAETRCLMISCSRRKSINLPKNMHADRFTVHYIIGETDDDKRHADFETGWIDEEKIKRLGFPVEEGSVAGVRR